jgi:hypothetical protein
MPRNATRSRSRRSRAPNMGYPSQEFIDMYGVVPYGNRRYMVAANMPITKVGQNLESRGRIIKSFTAGLRNFNTRRAELGYYRNIGETPATRSPSPKKGWCNFLGRCFTRKRRSK